MSSVSDTGPSRGHVAIVPSDTASLPPLRAIYFGTAGTYVCTDENNVDVPYVMQAGGRIDVVITKVKATGTTGGAGATGIVGWY